MKGLLKTLNDNVLTPKYYEEKWQELVDQHSQDIPDDEEEAEEKKTQLLKEIREKNELTEKNFYLNEQDNSLEMWSSARRVTSRNPIQSG